MVLDGVFLGDGQLEVALLLLYPLAQQHQQIHRPVHLLATVHYALRVFLLLRQLVLL